MVGVMIVPTGIGAEIGGHAGDATAAAKLLAAVCDKLIVHPNVVNGSDINEMTDNMLYVEGSILDRFLAGHIGLQEVASNKVLVVVNAPVKSETINSVSAARVTIGLDAEIVELETPLVLQGWIGLNGAAGKVTGWRELLEQVGELDFDALAITTPIDVDAETTLTYLRDGGVNPWGGVEAIASHLIADSLKKPVAHAPIAMNADAPLVDFREVVDPRMAAEIVSVSYVHCVLKGLHTAPRICTNDDGLSVRDISFMVTPAGCFGPAHEECLRADIPVIVVAENKTCLNKPPSPEFIEVANYWEAAGLIACMGAGIHPGSVRRPIPPTHVSLASA